MAWRVLNRMGMSIGITPTPTSSPITWRDNARGLTAPPPVRPSSTGDRYSRDGRARTAEIPRAIPVERTRSKNQLRAGDLARQDNQRRAGGAAPWISQFDKSQVPRAGNTACYRTCRVMARKAGVNVSDSTENRIQVATNEDKNGGVTTTPDRTARARNYIDGQLDRNRPVTVGVSYKDDSYNRDRITDHFVLVTGRGVDKSGRTFYTYNDPAAPDARSGTNNRFYVDPRTGNLVQPRGLCGDYQMSMVVPSS